MERSVIEEIIKHAERDAPIEACGYLMGNEGHITRHYPMTNAEAREDHFTFNPEEQFGAFKAARQEGLRIIGAYHSHPITPARPSAEDIKLAYDPKILYVIVSLQGGQKTVKGFYIKEEEAREEPLISGEDT